MTESQCALYYRTLKPKQLKRIQPSFILSSYQILEKVPRMTVWRCEVLLKTKESRSSFELYCLLSLLASSDGKCFFSSQELFILYTCETETLRCGRGFFEITSWEINYWISCSLCELSELVFDDALGCLGEENHKKYIKKPEQRPVSWSLNSVGSLRLFVW